VISELLLRSWGKDSRGPKIRRQVGVCLGQGSKHCHGKITSGTGMSTARCVDVINTSQVHELLWDQGGDNTRTTRGRNQTGAHRSALTSHLARDCSRKKDGKQEEKEIYVRGLNPMQGKKIL
jgi:hypothetical protein